MLNTSGPLDTRGHPSFEPIGTNGRACVTCHQPSDGMSPVGAQHSRALDRHQRQDPLFAAVDGMNCPKPAAGRSPSQSPQLLDPAVCSGSRCRGRRSVPDGTRIDPEFTIEIVRDPSGCNTDPRYGLNSATPTIWVYRRPRPVANADTTHQNFGVGPFIGKNGMPSATDPETGKPTSMNLMSDARAATLAVQAQDAARNHLQIAGTLSAAQTARITEFERQVYIAQVARRDAGSLVEADGPPAFGPAISPRATPACSATTPRDMSSRWAASGCICRRRTTTGENARNAARESIARGHDVFMFRTFWIKDSMHLNSVGLGNPVKRTCATCHGMHMTGMDTANGWMDIGTTNLPWATEVPLNPWTDAKPQMPLFRVTCRPGVRPHPFLGRVIYTQDPGRALISGLCNDVGTIVMEQFRGLAARAPYFSNGSAATLRELVDFYDRRYNIGYSEQEKRDLVNFLGAL